MSNGETPQPTGTLRASSVDAVLAELRTQGPRSQADLARLTGLSKGTINNVVKKLLSEQVVTLQKINKKEALVVLGSGYGVIATVEVRSQAIKATLFVFSAEKRFDIFLDVNEQNSDEVSTPEMVLSLIHQLCKSANLETNDISCLAVAIQAPIDRATGCIVAWGESRLPAWKDVQLVSWFETHLGIKTVVDNDANLAALAEWTWGSGRGSEDFLYLLCSEGVGGGLIIGGKIYRGGTGVAGEVGHMILEETGPVCFCGGRGCLHSLVSERAILAALDGSESPQLSLLDVIHAARNGDAACRRVLFEAGRSLSRAVANTARVMAPSAIAVGGTLSKAEDLLMTSINSAPEMQNLLSISSATTLYLAEVDDAVTLGSLAAALAGIGRGVSILPKWLTSPAPESH